MTLSPIQLKQITRNKFNILAGMTRSPTVMLMAKELEYYSDENENYLGTILLDKTDNDYSVVVLARDEFGKFCCMDLKVSFSTIEDARKWMTGTLKWNAASGTNIHPQGHDSQKTLKLFHPTVPDDKLHPYFRHLHSHVAFQGARKVISELMPHFVDIDGNFIQQFQTDGFDARLWELYVFAAMKESGFELERQYHSPDFVGSHFGDEVALEAVVVGRKPGDDIQLVLRPDTPKLTPDEIKTKIKNEMPIRFGSPLFTKLKKKYWLLDHVKGRPFVIAIADFHDDHSMIWSNSALYAYLYGKRYELSTDATGVTRPVRIDIESHTHEGKVIPSGFFAQPDSENVSAVITSASGTISKFNRMGRQAGYGDSNIKVLRSGFCHNHDPNAYKPKYFSYEVNEESEETWSEGLNVYHNPNAKYPLDPDAFPFAGHHTLKDGDIISMLPEFHPFSSWTVNLIPTGTQNPPSGLIRN